MTTPKKEPLQGIVPPLITPLRSRDELDIPGLERLIERVINGGVHGIFILGTSGEAPSLGYRLRRELITRTCKLVNGRVPVLVGITDTALVEALAVSRHAAEAGAQALVTSTPYYFPSGQPELVGFTRQLVAEAPLPLYLYNMPMMTKTQFDPETVRQLTDLEGIVGLKDSSGDLNYFRKMVEMAKVRPDWRFFIGPEHLLVDALRMGGHGGVNGGAQVYPDLLVGLYNAERAGDQARVTELQQRLVRLGQIYKVGKYASTVIKGMKCSLSLLGICSDEMAAPMSRFDPPEREKVRAVLEELNLLPAKTPKAAGAVA